MVSGPRTFAAWYLDLVDLSEVGRALDAGCGAGSAAVELRKRLRPGTPVIALDADRAAARAAASASGGSPLRGDIGALPLGSATIDLVIAGHVLYYAEPLEPWLLQLRRVMRPGAMLIATANSQGSARVLLDIHVEICRRAGLFAMAERALAPSLRDRFTLENGAAPLRRVFGRLDRRARADLLVIESLDAALTLYFGGLHTRGAEGSTSPSEARALARRLAPFARAAFGAACDADGRLQVPRRSGCFLARR